MERVDCSVPARVGEDFRLKVVQFGLPLEWVGYWDEVVPGECLVDGARKSPFRHWRHHHIFRADGAGTGMTDCVEYALPCGIFGRLLDVTAMRIVFTAMFLARHRATAKFFAQRKTCGE